MITLRQETREGYDRKLGTAYQQNLIEMVGYIYAEPKFHTKKSLANEFIKNGVTSERKIIRMVNDVNTFSPIIKRAINEVEFEAHYYLDKRRFSEADLDNYYKKSQNAELLYLFLTSLLIKPISTEDVMKKLNVDRRKANKMLENILDASYLIDEIETENGYIIGHRSFFE